MVNAVKLGQLVAEALLNDPGPCLYPGKFKPPHIGHFQVVKDLRGKGYIGEITIIVSNKTIDGITPEDSMSIWQDYLETAKIPNVIVQVSEFDSPIKDIVKFLGKSNADPVYLVKGNDESDDQDYATYFQENYGDRVKIIPANEKYGDISAPVVRSYLEYGDYDSLVDAIPVAAYNKGKAQKIFKTLAGKVKREDEPKEA
jgi:phosphopantetheine adenylyltransferase